MTQQTTSIESINSKTDNIHDIVESHRIINDELDQCSEMGEIKYSNIYHKIKRLLWAVFLTFFVSYLQFPAFVSEIKSQNDKINNNSQTPMNLLLILTFNVADYIGRNYLAGWTSFCFTKRTLWIGAFWRIVVLPIIILMYQDVIKSDVVAFIFVSVLGITNGHFCCLCYMWAPQLVNSNEQALCGTMMTCALVAGLTMGSCTALLYQKAQTFFKNS